MQSEQKITPQELEELKGYVENTGNKFYQIAFNKMADAQDPFERGDIICECYNEIDKALNEYGYSDEEIERLTGFSALSVAVKFADIDAKRRGYPRMELVKS